MASSQRRAAVLGRPIEHSLSPLLHRAAYAALGLDWTYETIECGAGELADVLRERADWAGFSCTMPVKHAALEVADEAGAVASVVGAANTLLPGTDGGWRAENTDVPGIVTALTEGAVRPATATILGAGGTAQATVVALAQLGLSSCGVLVRDVAGGRRLADTASAVDVQLAVSLLRPDAAELDADLVVSTLPPGAADAVSTRPWRADQALLDVVYDPWPTELAAAFQRSGATVIGGARVLLHQAAAQVELMTGLAAPVEAMRAALRAVTPAAG